MQKISINCHSASNSLKYHLNQTQHNCVQKGNLCLPSIAHQGHPKELLPLIFLIEQNKATKIRLKFDNMTALRGVCQKKKRHLTWVEVGSVRPPKNITLFMDDPLQNYRLLKIWTKPWSLKKVKDYKLEKQ